MTNLTGNRIKQLIAVKGFPSIRKFAEYLAESCKYDNVTADTIYNVVNGKNVRLDTLSIIAEGLGVSTECLTSEYMPFADEELDLRYSEIMRLSPKERKSQGISDLKWFLDAYDISKRVYPNDLGDIYADYNYKITTLSEMSIYLPLCDMEHLLDVIDRISGAIVGYEKYILEKYHWLYKSIPKSPAKDFADCQAVLMRLQNKNNLSEYEKSLLEKMTKYEQSEEFFEGYKQYREITEKKRALWMWIRQGADLIEDGNILL